MHNCRASKQMRYLALLMFAIAANGLGAPVDKAEFFEMKIRPILANRCYGCHSSAPLGGLAVNSRVGLLKGGKTGPAVVPGKPEESLLIQAVEHSIEKMKMPMGQGKMPDAEIPLLIAWIKDRALCPEAPAVAAPAKGGYVITAEQRKFWAFRPIARPAPPAVLNAACAAP